MVENYFAYPTLDTIKTALFIQPHPDDNEIGAGGTMTLLNKRGVKVYGLTVSLGKGGSDTIAPDELAEIRKVEAKEAMDVTGAIDLGNLGYYEIDETTHYSLVNDLVKVIRDIKPDAIFSVDPNLENETHPMHILVGNAFKEAFHRSGAKYYPNAKTPDSEAFTPKILGFYFTDSDNTIVDISETYELKLEAMAKHKSQLSKEYIAMLDQYFAFIASDTLYHRVERFKLLSAVHTHCFAIPKSLKQK